MPKFIQLIDENGEVHFVNPEKIKYIREQDLVQVRKVNNVNN